MCILRLTLSSNLIFPLRLALDAMKRLLLFTCFLLGLTLSSCQCSNPPPVGPVEGDDATVTRVP